MSHHLIKYEDIVAGHVDFDALGAARGLKLESGAALSLKVGGRAKKRRLCWMERRTIRRHAGHAMKTLGYGVWAFGLGRMIR